MWSFYVLLKLTTTGSVGNCCMLEQIIQYLHYEYIQDRGEETLLNASIDHSPRVSLLGDQDKGVTYRS